MREICTKDNSYLKRIGGHFTKQIQNSLNAQLRQAPLDFGEFLLSLQEKKEEISCSEQMGFRNS